MSTSWSVWTSSSLKCTKPSRIRLELAPSSILRPPSPSSPTGRTQETSPSCVWQTATSASTVTRSLSSSRSLGAEGERAAAPSSESEKTRGETTTKKMNSPATTFGGCTGEKTNYGRCQSHARDARAKARRVLHRGSYHMRPGEARGPALAELHPGTPADFRTALAP
eukprot:scaffold2739_cov257-Pinguiococcus_pyrenoidosus.AAC.5